MILSILIALAGVMGAAGVVLAAVIGLILGAALFSGDLVLRAYLGQRLFPMAAPTGGTILIGAWILLAVAALAALRS
jgi:uncharacterized membrane protein YgdD (TMEM256/DUF423 family)